MELLADWQYLAAQTHSEQGVDLFSGGPETKSSPMHVNMGQIVTSFGFFFLPCSILSICILVLDFVDGMPICAITLLTTTILHQCLAPQGTEEMNFWQVYKILRNGNIDIWLYVLVFSNR